MNKIKTPLFQLGREDFLHGEARPSHYPERAAGWDFEHRATNKIIKKVQNIKPMARLAAPSSMQ